MPAAARSLADDLRARDDAALVALLRARTDLATPVPSDTGSLAARASTRVSVQRALDRLDTPTLQVAEVLAALDEPASLRDVARGVGVSQTRVTPVLGRLRERALVWGSDRALRLVRTVADVLGPHPAGLGPFLADALGARSPARLAELAEDLALPPEGDPTAALDAIARHLGDAAELEKVLVDAPGPARELLDRLTWGPPVGSVEQANRPVRTTTAASPLEWLLSRGLLVPAGPDRVVLPREVGTALRGGRVLRSFDEEPPPLPAAQRRPDQVEATAAGQAADAVRLVEELAEAWSASPAPVLRSGGLGVRELRRAADRLDLDADHTAFVVELAWASGLVAEDGEVGPSWVPTPGYDVWRSGEAAERWTHLATSWLATSRVPGLVGTRDGRDGVRGALSADLDRPSVVGVRRDVLLELAAQDPGGSADADALAERMAWRAPRRAGALSRRLVEWTLREAGWLGVTGLGALTPAGRAMVADAPVSAVEQALAAALPEPIDHVLLQADLTAVAPGPLTADLAREMSLAADVDSRGGATVYRFTAASVRRALDAGRGADDLLRTLADHSRTPLPQPLEYLVGDVARRHGRLRVGAAGAYLRADDEGLLAEVLADRRASVLRLRRLAPTVLSAQADPGTVLDTLRDMGLAPAAEGPDGDVLLRRPDAHRSGVRERPRPLAAEPPAPPPALAESVVRVLRSGDGVAAERDRRAAESADVPRIPVLEPATSLAALREAVAGRRTVWVGLAEAGGTTTRRRVEPIGVDGGRVTVFDHALGDVRTLSVHRITGVAPAVG